MNATINQNSVYTTLTLATNMVFVFDPTGKHSNLNPNDILNYVGMIPSFIRNPVKSIEEQVIDGYGFPRSPMDGTASNSVYSSAYEDDPDLISYAKIIKLSAEGVMMMNFLSIQQVIAKYAVETLDIFPYAICVFTKSDGTQTTYRLD